MQLWCAIIAAVVCIGGGIMCLGIKRLRRTGRGMLVFGIVMAMYSVLTVMMMQRG